MESCGAPEEEKSDQQSTAPVEQIVKRLPVLEISDAGDSYAKKADSNKGEIKQDNSSPHQFSQRWYEEILAQARLADELEWIVYEAGCEEKSIDEFLEKFPPSTFVDPDAGWIYVSSRSKVTSNDTPDVEGLIEKWKQLHKSGIAVTKQMIFGLATKFKVLTGKWCIYASKGKKVDEIWEKIARAIVDDTITEAIVSAKVSVESEEEDDHVICVYNRDFTNKDEVMKAEELLRKIGIKTKMVYKPDVYTYLGIYRKNRYGLRPTLWHSNYDHDKGISSVTDPDCNQQRGGIRRYSDNMRSGNMERNDGPTGSRYSDDVRSGRRYTGNRHSESSYSDDVGGWRRYTGDKHSESRYTDVSGGGSRLCGDRHSESRYSDDAGGGRRYSGDSHCESRYSNDAGGGRRYSGDRHSESRYSDEGRSGGRYSDDVRSGSRYAGGGVDRHARGKDSRYRRDSHGRENRFWRQHGSAPETGSWRD